MSTQTPLQVPTVTAGGSLREQVTQALRGLIVTGRLKPGELYSAPTLAAEFGVSATPVREAMLDLAREGLVEAVRNKGFRVTQISDDLLDALAELRGFVEIPVMVMVAQECTGKTQTAVRRLRPVAERLLDLARAGDLEAYVTLDTEFHLSFLGLHANPFVVDVVRDLRHRSRLYGLQILADQGILQQTAAEHLQMVDAALNRDTTAMSALMTAHIGHVRKDWADGSRSA